MGYSDQKYFSFDLDRYGNAIAFGTATASGTSTIAQPSGVYLPNFLSNTIISQFAAVAASAPNTKQGGLLQLLNGTNTIITATYTSTTSIGANISGSYTGTYTATGTATKDKPGAVPANVILAGSNVTMQLVLNTATASGDSTGTWDVYLFDALHV